MALSEETCVSPPSSPCRSAEGKLPAVFIRGTSDQAEARAFFGAVSSRRLASRSQQGSPQLLPLANHKYALGGTVLEDWLRQRMQGY